MSLLQHPKYFAAFSALQRDLIFDLSDQVLSFVQEKKVAKFGLIKGSFP